MWFLCRRFSSGKIVSGRMIAQRARFLPRHGVLTCWLQKRTGLNPYSAMSRLVAPHGGGKLQPLFVAGAALAEGRKRALSLPKVAVSSREKGDLIMLGIGGFTPLDGFMTHADWR